MGFLGRFLDTLLKAASLRLWALLVAGPALTLQSAAFAYIIWMGGWPVTSAPEQLRYLGVALWVSLALLGVVIIALASVTVRAKGPGGLSFDVERPDDAAPVARVTTTTTVEEPQKAAP